MNRSQRRGMRYSVMSGEIHSDPAWGRWVTIDAPDETPLDMPGTAVRIVDHDGGGSYVAAVKDSGDRTPAQMLWCKRIPQRADTPYDEVRWIADAEVAARAALFLRRRREWVESHTKSNPLVGRGVVQYAEEEMDLRNGEPTHAEIAAQVRLARAQGVPIAAFFSAERGHPWAWSARTAARRIRETRNAGYLPEETGTRGPSDRTRKEGGAR